MYLADAGWLVVHYGFRKVRQRLLRPEQESPRCRFSLASQVQRGTTVGFDPDDLRDADARLYDSQGSVRDAELL
jgi:hypothetical protein